MLSSRAAGAQDPPSPAVAATALVDAGRQLMAEGRVAEACPKFREAARLAPPGLGALSQLAECYERVGELASAWSVWREVASGTLVSGQTARHRYAREQVERLGEALPRLAILVAEPTPGLRLLRDGEPLGAAQIGVAVPLDPGTHVVRATADGHQPWETSLVVDGGGSVTVRVPALAPLQPAAMAPTRPAPPALAPPPAPPPPPPALTLQPSPLGGQRLVGLVVAGAGAVSAGVGGALHVAAAHRLGRCPNERCSSEDDGEAYEVGQSLERGAIAMYVLGAVALVTGPVLFFTAPSSEPDATALRTRLALGPASVSLEAAW